MSDNKAKSLNDQQNKAAFWFLITMALIGVILMGGMFYLMHGDKPSESTEVATISDVAGKQTITITAKGGYTPSLVTAKANTATTLILKTNNTFDCSSAITIPSLNYKKNLPMRGETIVEIPAQEAGKEIDIICAMGMYSSKIKFS
jgi:P-type Cu+ transporter